MRFMIALLIIITFSAISEGKAAEKVATYDKASVSKLTTVPKKEHCCYKTSKCTTSTLYIVLPKATDNCFDQQGRTLHSPYTDELALGQSPEISPPPPKQSA